MTELVRHEAKEVPAWIAQVLSVRAESYQAVEAKTPELAIKPARRLLKGLNVAHLVGLRDRVVIGILIYTAARVGAVARPRRSDFYEVAGQACLRVHEKGGKVRQIPVRHDLLEFLQANLDQSGSRFAEPASPLFRSMRKDFGEGNGVKWRKLSVRAVCRGKTARSEMV